MSARKVKPFVDHPCIKLIPFIDQNLSYRYSCTYWYCVYTGCRCAVSAYHTCITNLKICMIVVFRKPTARLMAKFMVCTFVNLPHGGKYVCEFKSTSFD